MAYKITLAVTFLFPVIVVGLIWLFGFMLRKKNTESAKTGQLVDLLEKLNRSKDSIIDKLEKR